MRGGTKVHSLHGLANWGLSPHARGNLGLTVERPAAMRPIPACAGEPPTRATWGRCSWAYPRMRGGTELA